jgi:alpha-L-fucosidase
VRSFEYRLPDGILDEPWEMRRGLGASFGLNRAETPDHLLSADGIVALLTEVLAKGGHLLLAVGPDAQGRIPLAHARRLRAAGEWVARHRRLVDRAVPWSHWGDEHVRYLVHDGDVHAVDVSGSGRFDALAKGAGRVTAVARVRTPTGTRCRSTSSSATTASSCSPVPASTTTSRDPDTPHIEVYRIILEPHPPAPIELFPAEPAPMIELAPLLADASSGQIVQLGDGTYVGPARVPDGVTVRGLGPDRTRIDGIESVAIVLGDRSRVEHCALAGGGARIAWLPKTVVRIAGTSAMMLGCRVDGHVEVAGSDARLVSCTATGVLANGVDRVSVMRCTFTGVNWDCAIDLIGGTGHVVESCDIATVLEAVRLTRTVGAHVRGNRIRAGGGACRRSTPTAPRSWATRSRGRCGRSTSTAGSTPRSPAMR